MPMTTGAVKKRKKLRNSIIEKRDAKGSLTFNLIRPGAGICSPLAAGTMAIIVRGRNYPLF